MPNSFFFQKFKFLSRFQFLLFFNSFHQPWAMTIFFLWQGHNTTYLLAVGCESSGSHVLWNRWSRWRFVAGLSATCRWSRWRHKPSGQSIANVYASIGGVLYIIRLSIHIVFISEFFINHISYSNFNNKIYIHVVSKSINIMHHEINMFNHASS